MPWVKLQKKKLFLMYEQGGQMFSYAVEMERFLELKEGERNHKNRKVGFFVPEGPITLKNAAIWTE